MFCFRRGVKPLKKPLPATCSVNSLDDVLADSNASFLRAARAGNLEKVLEFLKGNIDINTSNANGLNALHLAAKEGHVEVVTELLKNGANVNAATKKGNTALHIASLAGQDEVVKVLVNLGANVNVQSQNGFTPLYMAAQENHDGVVSFLLANKANQSLATEDGFTPLAVALQQGHDKVVAVLLENDTKGRVRLPALHIAAKKDDCKAASLLLQNDHNPDVTSKSGFTPLHIAAHYGNEKIANILLDKAADVNYAAKHQITPLHVASKWGKTNMVGLLIDKGAKIEAVTRDGLTPLHCAARSGHDQVVDLLLEKGAPILAKTKNGLAPLHMASQGDHVDSARILLYHKAPVDDVTVDYLTALHVAAHCGHAKVAKLLLDRKADPNARALNGFTPLHIACKKNRIKVVELLLKHGASIEATTESGLSPLHVASFMGCMNIVIYLIQSGANPDVPTVRGETPLHLAARANQIDIIRILLRNGASVDARAREEQTPLHIAARLGNVDIVSLLLQHGAAVDATTKDMYTALHIAAKEGQEEVSAVLLDHEASLVAPTKRGFTPLHLAAKYGNIKVVRLLLQKDAPVDAQGKNGLTPLHVAAHYNHVNEALLLLEKGASPHATAKNGYAPLHIAAKKNQMDIATTLLEYGAKCNAESKAGYIPLHLSSQEGHTDMTSLLIEHQANVNNKASNGLTPLHLCAQEDRVDVASVLLKNGAEIGPQSNAGYTPLHVASHFGQMNMVRFLLQNNADVHMTTQHGYTPLHQAAQQGHTPVVNLLLENKASPNETTSQGQTALSIAQRLGYISVVETLKVVTETTVTTTTTTVTEEKYKVVSPEIMQETFMTDSEDEGGEDTMLGDQSYRYLTADEMKSLGDDSLPIDVTKDEKHHEVMHMLKDIAAPMVEEDNISPQHITPIESGFSEKFSPDNIDISRAPVHAGFLVSFMVDARGGAMRGCRHSGVRVIIPPRKASMPMRITCRYLRKEKLIHPPPLMEGEACASRILEVGPVGARFLGPVIIEVPHFASLRGREREVTILRSDTGETWREHSLEASEEAVQDVLNESFEGDELSALEDLNTNRITRILTTDFPQYFAIVTRIRQEVHGVGPEGGMVSSTVVPQVQAIFPEGALQKKIRVGLQAQPIAPELVAKLLGNRVAVSPIVTVEPRRRKFHKPITLTIPVPQAATKGMINQYSGDAPTLRLLCSITGGSTKAQWEDVTGSTPLTFVNDCVSFTTTVSARFWLMDCRQVSEVSRFATDLYQEAVHVPFMAKFVVFAKRHDPNEAQLRVFCMTDDKEDKTLETQEHFSEIAKSRDVEVLEGKLQYLEFAGNLVPVTNSGEQLKFVFHAFHENRLPFVIRVKDPHVEPMGRIAFMKEPKVGRGEPPQTPICNLNIAMPEVTVSGKTPAALELVTLEKKYDFMQESGLSKPESIHRANLRLSDIARELDKDWVVLANELRVSESDISIAKSEFADDIADQALTMLRLWLQKSGSKATGNELEKALRKINRADIIKKCMFNVELVTDDVEKAVAKVHLDQSGFDVFKEELGSSREASMRRGTSLDVYDEQDIMKEAESAAETSSETGSLFERDQISQVLSDEKENTQPLDHLKGSLDTTPNKLNSTPKQKENGILIISNHSVEMKTFNDEKIDKTEEQCNTENVLSNVTPLKMSNVILEEHNNIYTQKENDKIEEYIINSETISPTKNYAEEAEKIEKDIIKLALLDGKDFSENPKFNGNEFKSDTPTENVQEFSTYDSIQSENGNTNETNRTIVQLNLQNILPEITRDETVTCKNGYHENVFAEPANNDVYHVILTDNKMPYEDTMSVPSKVNDPTLVEKVADLQTPQPELHHEVNEEEVVQFENGHPSNISTQLLNDSTYVSKISEDTTQNSANTALQNHSVSSTLVHNIELTDVPTSEPNLHFDPTPNEPIKDENGYHTNISPELDGSDIILLNEQEMKFTSSPIEKTNEPSSGFYIEELTDLQTPWSDLHSETLRDEKIESENGHFSNVSPNPINEGVDTSKICEETTTCGDIINPLSSKSSESPSFMYSEDLSQFQFPKSDVYFESAGDEIVEHKDGHYSTVSAHLVNDDVDVAELTEEIQTTEDIPSPQLSQPNNSSVRIEECTDLFENTYDKGQLFDSTDRETLNETKVAEQMLLDQESFPVFPEKLYSDNNVNSDDVMATIYESLQENNYDIPEISNEEQQISNEKVTSFDEDIGVKELTPDAGLLIQNYVASVGDSNSILDSPHIFDSSLSCIEHSSEIMTDFQHTNTREDLDSSDNCDNNENSTFPQIPNEPYFSNQQDMECEIKNAVENKTFFVEQVEDMEAQSDSDFGEHRIRRVSKTPPPSPAEPQEKDTKPIEIVPEQTIVKEITTTIIKTTVTDVVPEELQVVAPKMTESETWPSGEMDISQVSISSLPDDEKSEPTTATASSAIVEEDVDKIIKETKEWTDADETMEHAIERSTHIIYSTQEQHTESISEDEGILEDDADEPSYVEEPNKPDSELAAKKERDLGDSVTQDIISTCIGQNIISCVSNAVTIQPEMEIIHTSEIVQQKRDISEDCLEMSESQELARETNLPKAKEEFITESASPEIPLESKTASKDEEEPEISRTHEIGGKESGDQTIDVHPGLLQEIPKTSDPEITSGKEDISPLATSVKELKIADLESQEIGDQSTGFERVEEDAVQRPDHYDKNETTQAPTLSSTATRTVTSMNVQELPMERTVVQSTSTSSDVLDPSKPSYDATKPVFSEDNKFGEDSH